VLITGVLQNGPAAQAGMRPGDVVVQVAGKAGGQRVGAADQRGGAQAGHRDAVRRAAREDKAWS
jgi:S1-C subfamily serine protease